MHNDDSSESKDAVTSFRTAMNASETTSAWSNSENAMRVAYVGGASDAGKDRVVLPEIEGIPTCEGYICEKRRFLLPAIKKMKAHVKECFKPMYCTVKIQCIFGGG